MDMLQPSNIVLKVGKGVVTDYSNEDLERGFAIASINGRFLPARDGKSFQWIGVRGEKVVTITGTDWTSNHIIVAMEVFQGTIIAFVKLSNTSETAIFQLTATFGADTTVDSFTATQLVSDPNNTYLQLSTDNPISKIRIVYETNTIFTIYWNERVSAIKSIRIINGSGTGTL